MANIQLSETEIMARVSSAANDANINITLHVRIFFLRLLRLAEVDENGYYIKQPVADIGRAVDMPTRTVSYCLSCLVACGILYTHGRSKPQLRRINSDIIGTGLDSRGLRKKQPEE